MTTHSILPVILCGGSGTRLWPLSRTNHPKQFLKLFGHKTLFQQALGRATKIIPSSSGTNNILVVTNEEHRFTVLDQLKNMKETSVEILLEPFGKNTAPALTFAALHATKTNEDPILIITPADHVIENEISFLKLINKSIKVALHNSVVILGIKPNRADINYGYIKYIPKKGHYDEFDIISFEEKPSLIKAKKYLNSGGYLWNSGIFIMKASIWIKLLDEFRPDILKLTKNAYKNSSQDKNFIRPCSKLFKKIPSESIDYAVMEQISEKSSCKAMVLDADWDDLGSWNAIWRSDRKDKFNNVSHGDSILSGTTNSLIFSNSRLVVTSGVDNLVIVETPDVVLVIKKNKAQDIVKILKELSFKKRQELNLHRKIFRPWGWFDTIDNGERFKVKRIQVNPGASLSLQKHKKRAEHWIVVKGLAKIISDEKILILKENESTYIPVGAKHQLSNPGREILEIIEVQSGSYLGEDDIQRFEDKYGRAKKVTKVALITGITGQDGAYLAKFLLDKDYIVHGVKRRSSLFNTDRIDHLYKDPHSKNNNFFLHYGDLSDSTNLIRIIQQTQPDEIYNLAAMSHVAVSFDTPEYTANVDGLGALRILEAIRILGLNRKTKFYQASSSELYGMVQETPQSERTPFYPRSPYAVAKLYAYWITVNYREAYNIFSCNGILFNHESPIRGETFVTRKITRALSRIKLGLQDALFLGNLDSLRDWGHARDYVEAQWLILQQDKPEDFVIASGIQYSVRDFINASAKELGMKILWKGKGLEEKGYLSEKQNNPIIFIDPRYFRPSEVDSLLGDASKAKKKLGWEPKISFNELVAEMTEEDFKLAKRDKFIKDHGYQYIDHKE